MHLHLRYHRYKKSRIRVAMVRVSPVIPLFWTPSLHKSAVFCSDGISALVLLLMLPLVLSLVLSLVLPLVLPLVLQRWFADQSSRLSPRTSRLSPVFTAAHASPVHEITCFRG